MAKKEALLVYLYRTVGFSDGMKAAGFVVSWGIYSDDPKTAGPPTADGYRAYWGISESTYFRELRSYRKAFPDDPFPDRIWSVLRRHVESRKVASATKQAVLLESVWN